MDRRQKLFADSEEQLLEQQREFLQQRGTPSASVTRVRKPGTATNTPAPAVAAPVSSSQAHAPEAQRAGPPGPVVEMAAQDVVGDIQEKPFAADDTPLNKKAQGAADNHHHHHHNNTVPTGLQPTAFPQATHRKQSKFALGRRKAHDAQCDGGGRAAAPAPRSDEAVIHVDGGAGLGAMGPQEVADALSELHARLPPKTLAFLKARGASKAAAAAVGTQTALHPTPQTCPPAKPKPAPPQPPCAQPPAAANPPSPAVALEAAGLLPSDPRLLARIRWGLEGHVLSVQPAGQLQQALAVEAEPVLVQDEAGRQLGWDPAGYTITELLVLARSEWRGQRQAAMGALTALLTAARPGLRDAAAASAGAPPRAVVVPGHLLAEAAASAQPSGAESAHPAPPADVHVPWAHIWRYLVEELAVTSHLRLALDGEDPVWACKALAALVCPAPDEAAVAEILDACPHLGWPRSATAPLVRPTSGAVWAPALPAPEGGGVGGAGSAATEAAAAVLGASAAPAPEDVAAHDPVAGLLQMQAVPRLLFVLSTTAPDPGRGVQALRLLAALAEHGEAAALDVARCPGLLPCLNRLLLDGHSLAPSPDNPDVTASHAPMLGVSVHALRLVRTLCTAGPTCAQLIASSGLLATVQGHLLVSCSALAAAQAAAKEDGAFTQHALRAVEALRAWRACAAHGVACMAFEGVHEALVQLMPFARCASTANAAAASTPIAAALAWHIAREAYLLLSALLAHALAVSVRKDAQGPSMIQPGTAAALVVSSCLPWLDPGAVRHLAAAWVDRSARQPALGTDTEASHRAQLAAGVHPLLLLSPLAAMASCWAAALHAAATYWASLPADLPVFGQAGATLRASGLLAAAEPAVDSKAAPVPAAATGARDRLTETLLKRRPEAVGVHTDSSRVGAALTAALCQEVAGPLPGAANDAACHQLAAAELLAALLSLSAAVPGTASAAGIPIQRAAAQALVAWTSLHQPGGAKALASHELTLLGAAQPLARLLLVSCDACDACDTPAAQDVASSTATTDALLCVLCVSAPGAETQALQALRLLTHSARLQPLLTTAQHAITQLQSQHPLLHLCASGVPFSAMQGAVVRPDGSTTPQATVDHDELMKCRIPYPSPSCPSPEAVGDVLLRGYSAAWLSMLAVDRLGGELDSHSSGSDVEGRRAATRRPALLAYPVPRLRDASESRLPAPPTWPAAEVLQVPQLPASRTAGRRRGTNSEGGAGGTGTHPVAAALMLVCGLQARQSQFLAAAEAAAGGCAALLRSALLLAYVQPTDALLVDMARAGGGRGRPATAGSGTVDDGQAMQWMEPGMRWPLAALTAAWLALPGPGRPSGVAATCSDTHLRLPPPKWCSVADAERLAQQFGAVSFGDPLFAQHVTLLLLPSNTPEVQVAAWVALAQDQALHLLPPPALCILPPPQLMGAPSRHTRVVNAYAGSLMGGVDLARAQSTSSVAAALAAVTVAAYVCDPRGGQGGGGEDAVQGRVTTAMRQLLGAAAGSGGTISSSSQDGDARRAEVKALGLARQLVQALVPAALHVFLETAAAYGWPRSTVIAALRRAVGHDSALRAKLDEVADM